jgi:hypothetical protein
MTKKRHLTFPCTKAPNAFIANAVISNRIGCADYMFDRTTSRNFLAPRRQERKERIFSCFSELGVLCVFARVISLLPIR